MKAVILVLLSVVLAVPALAGPPVNGTYKSTDIGGAMTPGRYSEYWFGAPLAVNNTLNEKSWDGSVLGGEWWWYCPWIVSKALLVNTVNGAGNGQKIWRVTYTGGYCWLNGPGEPWDGGDASYTANINTWIAIVTETYSAFNEVGTVRNHNATATFVGYNNQCMNLAVSNIEKLGDTNDGPLPANFPDFWSWFGCVSVGTAGPGEWGDVDSITFTVTGCEAVATQQKSWGAVKALYR